MNDTTKPVVKTELETEGGVAGEHPPPGTHIVLVGPTVSDEFNKVRAALVPVGCWRLDDIRFEFDSSIVRPEAEQELRKLAKLCSDHPNAPISLFGHADPVGNHTYNKALSGRRAAAIYGLLTRDVAVWEKLYNSKVQGVGDSWKYAAVQIMLKTLGHDPGPPTGSLTATTVEAVKSFQRANGLQDDGDPGPLTRGKLFPQYMDRICRGTTGEPFHLARSDFLGKGADPDGKADYQGCGEFNPVLMFSKSEKQEFDNSANQQERDDENASNRRVLALLLRPGTKINPARWPCPAAKEGTAKCEKRFWSDAAVRRQFQEKRRTFEDDKDTFACRFYHRLMTSSPCEKRAPLRITFGVFLLDSAGHPIAGARWRLGSDGHVLAEGVSDGSGLARIRASVSSDRVEIEWTRSRPAGPKGEHYLYRTHYFVRAPQNSDEGLQRMLANLGYTQCDDLAANVRDFQMQLGLPVTGNIEDIAAQLQRWHESGDIGTALADDAKLIVEPEDSPPEEDDSCCSEED